LIQLGAGSAKVADSTRDEDLAAAEIQRILAVLCVHADLDQLFG